MLKDAKSLVCLFTTLNWLECSACEPLLSFCTKQLCPVAANMWASLARDQSRDGSENLGF